jgi:hypothetical protein
MMRQCEPGSTHQHEQHVRENKTMNKVIFGVKINKNNNMHKKAIKQQQQH